MLRRRLIRVSLGLVALAVVLAAAGYGYLVFVTRDAPAPASLGTAPEGALGGTGSADGTWIVAPSPINFAGYRMRERIGPVAAPSDAVSRTDEVSGSITIEGPSLTALAIDVELASLDSGVPHRDQYVRDDALDVESFPTAALRLTEPVAVGPPMRGEVIDVVVDGQLTLRGETRAVEFTVQARWNGATIQAAGSTTINRNHFGIDVTSRAGFNIAEEGVIEFEVTFSPAGASVAETPPTLVDNSVVATDEGEFRPPCQGDETLVVDPPLLVDAYAGDRAVVESVSGAGAVTEFHASSGLTGGASWSPDGNDVIFSASSSPDEPRTLFVSSATQGTPRAIPTLVDVTYPDWSAGGQLAYVQRSGERSDIWTADPDGMNARLLIDTPGTDTDPRWSPDGALIVFTTGGGPGNQDVMIAGADGSGVTTLAGGPGYEYAPSFTPDGKRVVFVRDGSIFVVGVDGTGERRLTDGPSDTNPSVSPDGRRLAFIRDGSLFVANADGSGAQCVATGQPITGGPRWRP